jgi:hypothetical protein
MMSFSELIMAAQHEHYSAGAMASNAIERPVPLPLTNIMLLKSRVHKEAGTTALVEQASSKSLDFFWEVALLC